MPLEREGVAALTVRQRVSVPYRSGMPLEHSKCPNPDRQSSVSVPYRSGMPLEHAIIMPNQPPLMFQSPIVRGCRWNVATHPQRAVPDVSVPYRSGMPLERVGNTTRFDDGSVFQSPIVRGCRWNLEPAAGGVAGRSSARVSVPYRSGMPLEPTGGWITTNNFFKVSVPYRSGMPLERLILHPFHMIAFRCHAPRSALAAAFSVPYRMKSQTGFPGSGQADLRAVQHARDVSQVQITRPVPDIFAGFACYTLRKSQPFHNRPPACGLKAYRRKSFAIRTPDISPSVPSGQDNVRQR